MKRLRHLVEAAFVFLVYGGFRLLPLPAASALGGWLGRRFGMLVPVTRDARAQLAAILPELSAARREEILRGVWENLGRFAGELPHVHRQAMAARVSLEGAEHLAGLPGPYLFVSAHFGNWEILPGALRRISHPIHLLYRPSNNPYVERLVQRLRARTALGQLAKGVSGARGMHRAVKAGESLGILVDQKENNGVAIPFFGVPAMTGILPARLAQGRGLPLVPVHVRRRPGPRFTVTIDPPILPGRDADAAGLMALLHRRIEGWIRAHPEQWFWVHHRWPRAIYRGEARP